MAIHCRNHGFLDPFENSFRVYDAQVPEVGTSEKLDSKRVEAEKKITEAKDLLPETVSKLNGILEKLAPEEMDAFLDNLDIAILEFSHIERLNKEVSPKMQAALKTVFAERNKVLADYKLTEEDIEALSKVREDMQDRIELMEAHFVQSTEKVGEIKMQALKFVRKAGSNKPLLRPGDIEPGAAYIFDFRNPSTGQINTFAQRNITLADAMRALKLSEVQLKKRTSSKLIPAYLWPDRGAYGEAHSVKPGEGTASDQNYLAVIEGDSFIPAVEKPEPRPAVAQSAPNDTVVQGEGISSVTGRPRPVDGSDAGIPHGALGYRESFEDEMERGAPDAPISVTASPEVVSKDYSNLLGKKATIPADLRDENSWEQIQNLKYKAQGGDEVYKAIVTLAEIRTAEGLNTDNRTMWEEIFGLGPKTVNFNELVRAAYNIQLFDKRYDKPGEWLIKEYGSATGERKKTMKMVLDAGETILTKLPNLKDSGISEQAYLEAREAGISPEMAGVSKYTDDYLFDRESLGPPVQLSTFQSIGFWLSGKDRPVVTPDNWLDPVAVGRKKGEAPNYGEIEVISQSRAYAKLMATGSPEAYVEALSKYRIMGEIQINAMAGLGGTPGIKVDEKEIHTAPITLPDVNSGKVPNEDQQKAIHYGMMLEAAKELRLYQDAEEVVSQEEKERRAYNRTGDVYGTGFVGASTDLPAESFDDMNVGGSAGLSARAKVLPGTTADLGLEGSLWDDGDKKPDTVGTDLDVRTGLTWESRRYGKHKRGRVGGGVHGSYDLLDGGLGVDANVYAKHDLDKHGVWAAKAGAGAELNTVDGASFEAELGVEQDMGRLYEQRLREFKEKHGEDIEAAKSAARTKIDEAEGIDEASKEALKQASDAYIDMLVEQGVMKDWTRLTKQLKFAGAGVKVGGSLNLKKLFKNGVRIGPFITFAFGFKPTTFYVKPVSESGPGGSVDASEMIPEDSEMIEIRLPEEVLYTGGEAEKAEAIERATEKWTAATEARNAGLKDHVELTRAADLPYDKMNFKNLDGIVKLYVDPNSDIEVITDGHADNYLNIALENNLHIEILEYRSSQGGPTEYEIYLSEGGATPQDIRSSSEAYLTWIQQQSGAVTGSTNIIRKNEGVPPKNIYTLPEASAAGLETRNKNPEDLVEEVTYDELVLREGARDATLFDEYSEADFARASRVGKELINSGVDYDSLALGKRDEEINKKIVELYAQDSDPLTADKVTIDHIYMARQHAMEVNRPHNVDMPIEWNADAFELFAGEASKLYNDYLSDNKEAIEKGGLRGTFPEGSEFYISISHKGVAQGEALLLGYYDKRLHGDILAPIEWSAQNPDATLEALGMNVASLSTEDHEKMKESVIKVAKLIETNNGKGWPPSPFNTLSEATFEKAKYTIAGELLLTNAEALYGTERGRKLRDMAMGGEKDTALEAEFLQDVQELLSDTHKTMVGETPVILQMEVRSGLYEKCLNLTISRNFLIKFQPPVEKPATVTVERKSTEEGLRPEQAFTNKVVEVGIGLPSIDSKTTKVNANEGGSSSQDDQQDPDDSIPQGSTGSPR